MKEQKQPQFVEAVRLLAEMMSEIIAEKVQEGIKLIPSDLQKHKEEDEFLSTEEACQFLGICEQTLKSRRNAGLIPQPFKNGRFNVYRKSDLINSLRPYGK